MPKQTAGLWTTYTIKEGVLDGVGIGAFPRFFIAGELAAGRLARALPAYEMDSLSINAVYASRRHVAPKVRAFVDFLVERLPTDVL